VKRHLTQWEPPSMGQQAARPVKTALRQETGAERISIVFILGGHRLGAGMRSAPDALLMLNAGLNPGPKPIHQSRGTGVMRIDSIEPRHGGFIGIDGAVVEDRGVDQGLAGKIAVGIG
jgi:hypothetical protein